MWGEARSARLKPWFLLPRWDIGLEQLPYESLTGMLSEGQIFSCLPRRAKDCSFLREAAKSASQGQWRATITTITTSRSLGSLGLNPTSAKLLGPRRIIFASSQAFCVGLVPSFAFRDLRNVQAAESSE